jgi:imidazolonepropionase
VDRTSRREGTIGKKSPTRAEYSSRGPKIAAAPLLLCNIRQLLTLRSSKPGPRCGPDLSELGIVEDGAVLCAGGKIVSVGTSREALRDPWLRKNRRRVREIDCRGKVVLPGFVDSHTHPAFVGPRLVDFEKRIAGASYEEIARSGGGIRSSVEGVRKASRDELAQRVLAALNGMAAEGTTTVEAKSGYGLNTAAELKSLAAIHEASRRWPGTVVATLLGAHVVPREHLANPETYVRMICEEMVPQVAEQNLARFVDVFCEDGAFSLEDTQRIFQAAIEHGLGVRAHVCQLSTCELSSLFKFQPASLDHMDFISDSDISQLARTETVATLVPGANYFLGTDRFAPARKLIDNGVAVALATDFNPGSSPTCSMPFVSSLACTQMRMSPAETISASTMNGAWALRLQNRKGTIEPGKDADLAVFDVSDYREIAYWVATNRCFATVLGGELQLTN